MTRIESVEKGPGAIGSNQSLFLSAQLAFSLKRVSLRDSRSRSMPISTMHSCDA